MSKGDGNKEDDVQDAEVTQAAPAERMAPAATAVPNVQLASPNPEVQGSAIIREAVPRCRWDHVQEAPLPNAQC